MTQDVLRHEVNRFLHSWRTAGLATVDGRGRPHAVNIWFAVDGQQRLYFVSSLDAAHTRHLIRDPHVALTIYGHTDNPRHIHGLQIHGLCLPIAPPPEGDARVWQQAWDVYSGRFPFVAKDPVFSEAVESQCFFRVQPVWLRWLDNRKGFGFKVERDWMELKPAKRKGGTAKKKARAVKKKAAASKKKKTAKRK